MSDHLRLLQNSFELPEHLVEACEVLFSSSAVVLGTRKALWTSSWVLTKRSEQEAKRIASLCYCVWFVLQYTCDAQVAYSRDL